MKNTKKVLKLWLIMFTGIVAFTLIGLGLLWLSTKYPRAVPISVLVLVVAGITLYGGRVMPWSHELQLVEFNDNPPHTLSSVYYSIKNNGADLIGREFVQDKNNTFILITLKNDENKSASTFSVDPHIVLAYHALGKVNVFFAISPAVAQKEARNVKYELIRYFISNYPGWKLDWGAKDKCFICHDEDVYYNPRAKSFQWQVQKEEARKK